MNRIILESLLLKYYPNTNKRLVSDMEDWTVKKLIACAMNRELCKYYNKNTIIARKLAISIRTVQKWFPSEKLKLELAAAVAA